MRKIENPYELTEWPEILDIFAQYLYTQGTAEYSSVSLKTLENAQKGKESGTVSAGNS